MENKQYNNYQSSGLCTGYGNGISCVACCRDIGAPCWPGPEAKDLFAIDLNKRLNDSAHLCNIDEYASQDALGLVKPTFQHLFKLFNEQLEKNTSSFEAKIKQGVKLEEIARMPGSFFGKIQGITGCLLYPAEPQQDHRLGVCRSYLCDLAKYYQGSEILDFVKENAGRLNTFIYSRMIHAINYNPQWLNDILGLSISFRKDRQDCMRDLGRLLEIVKI